MWPLPRYSDKHVQIIVEEHTISCYYLLADTMHGALPKATIGLQMVHSDNNILYNIATIYKEFASFIKQHNLKDAYSSLIITKPFINEQLKHHHTSDAQLHMILKPLPHYSYQYTLMGAEEDIFLYYIATIAQTLLTQLYIIHERLGLHLQAIYPSFSTQLMIYQYIQGDRYNQSKCLQAVDRNNITIPEITTHPLVKNYLKNYTADKDRVTGLYALGSFIGSNI